MDTKFDGNGNLKYVAFFMFTFFVVVCVHIALTSLIKEISIIQDKYVEKTYETLENDLIEKLEVTLNIIQRNSIRTFIDEEGNLKEQKQLENYLKKVEKIFLFKGDVLIGMSNGDLFVENDSYLFKDLADATKKEWYMATEEMNSGRIYTKKEKDEDGDAVLVMTCPIFSDNGSLICVSGKEITGEDIKNFISSSRAFNYKSNITLYDGDGKCIFEKNDGVDEKSKYAITIHRTIGIENWNLKMTLDVSDISQKYMDEMILTYILVLIIVMIKFSETNSNKEVSKKKRIRNFVIIVGILIVLIPINAINYSNLYYDVKARTHLLEYDRYMNALELRKYACDNEFLYLEKIIQEADSRNVPEKQLMQYIKKVLNLLFSDFDIILYIEGDTNNYATGQEYSENILNVYSTYFKNSQNDNEMIKLRQNDGFLNYDLNMRVVELPNIGKKIIIGYVYEPEKSEFDAIRLIDLDYDKEYIELWIKCEDGYYASTFTRQMLKNKNYDLTIDLKKVTNKIRLKTMKKIDNMGLKYGSSLSNRSGNALIYQKLEKMDGYFVEVISNQMTFINLYKSTMMSVGIFFTLVLYLIGVDKYLMKKYVEKSDDIELHGNY